MKRFVLIGLLTALLMSHGAVSAQGDDERCLQKGGIWDAEKKECIVEAGYTINISYPLELTDNPFVESTIDQFLKQTRDAFVAEYNQNGDPSPIHAWSLYVRYEVFHAKDRYLGIKFDVNTYTGGAHPLSAIQTMTLDLTENKVLTSADLLTSPAALNQLAPLAETVLREQLKDMLDETMLTAGTQPTPENFQSLLVTDTDLIIYFSPYQVAPYAAGIQVVKLPLSQLKGIVADQFLS
ncbi:MAG: DUF3298 and DUF4163 domain-containing protein [Anaerolineae bacterium]|nr:DUF3298 and DUF4163 domain-containing protein [Anaerolineae bacterium]